MTMQTTTLTLPTEMLSILRKPILQELEQLQKRSAELNTLLSQIGENGSIQEAPKKRTRTATKKEHRTGLLKLIYNILITAKKPLTCVEISKEVKKSVGMSRRDARGLEHSISSMLYQYSGKASKEGYQFERTLYNKHFIYSAKTFKK